MFEDEELEALIDEDCCQTQEELAESLVVTQAAIPKRLKAAGYIQKQGNWMPHEQKPRDVERRFCMSEMLLERHKKKSFFSTMSSDLALRRCNNSIVPEDKHHPTLFS